MNDHLPRFEATRRREFLRRATLLGAAGLVPGLASCGNDDAELLAADPTTSTDPTTTTAPDTTTAASAPVVGAPLPAGARLEVAFTYTAVSAGGPVRNPFIAAWVETAAGDLVRNLSLWYNPPKGNRWINQLSAWYSADEAYFAAHGSDDLEAVTGASRPAGAHVVEWDGTDEAGGRAARGDYVVFVESAREHGPHSLISASLTLGSEPEAVVLSDDGELAAATATYTV